MEDSFIGVVVGAVLNTIAFALYFHSAPMLWIAVAEFGCGMLYGLILSTS